MAWPSRLLHDLLQRDSLSGAKGTAPRRHIFPHGLRWAPAHRLALIINNNMALIINNDIQNAWGHNYAPMALVR
jgi:hypothetical protein